MLEVVLVHGSLHYPPIFLHESFVQSGFMGVTGNLYQVLTGSFIGNGRCRATDVQASALQRYNLVGKGIGIGSFAANFECSL